MKILTTISRYLVGALFIFSGAIKINDPIGTSIKLEEYFHVFENDIASFFGVFAPAALFLAVVLSVLEVVLGVALFLQYRMKITSWILLSLIIFFTFLTFYSAYFNKVTDCGCFGDAIKLTPWQSFYKDIILTILIGFIFYTRSFYVSILDMKKGDIVIGAATLFNILTALHMIAHLPFIDFRPYKIGANIPKLMQPSDEYRYKYIMEKDGKEYEFEKYPTEGGYEYKEMVLLNPEAQPKITDYNVWNNEMEFTQITFEGLKLLVAMYDVNQADEDGVAEVDKLVKEIRKTDIPIVPMILTASDEKAFQAFAKKTKITIPFFFSDAVVLKAMVRSNPGILLMQNGVVKGKWHYNDIPDLEKIKTLIE